MTVVERPKTPPLESSMYRPLASIGSADVDELRYQAEKKGLPFDEAELERLEEEGHAVDVSGTWSIVVPERVDRGNGRGPQWTVEEIIERVKLWALITGRPPGDVQWGKRKLLKTLIARHEHRLAKHLEALHLFDEGDWPTGNTVSAHFGSLNAALVAAGFDARPTGGTPADELDAERRDAKALAGRKVSCEEAYERLRREREADEPDQERLHAAYVELAMAAFNEADRIRPWDPGGDE